MTGAAAAEVNGFIHGGAAPVGGKLTIFWLDQSWRIAYFAQRLNTRNNFANRGDMSPARPVLVTLGILGCSLAIVTAPAKRALGDPPSAVTVANPSTAPALTSDIDNPGRMAYQNVAIGQQNGTTCAGSASCTFSFPAVPPGRRLVVQHVSGALTFNGTPNAVEVSLSSFGAQTKASPPAFSAFFVPSVDDVSWFDQQVLVYFDAGSAPIVTVVNLAPSATVGGSGVGKPAPAFTADTQPVTLTGYLLHCKAAPCATIVPTVTP